MAKVPGSRFWFLALHPDLEFHFGTGTRTRLGKGKGNGIGTGIELRLAPSGICFVCHP